LIPCVQINFFPYKQFNWLNGVILEAPTNQLNLYKMNEIQLIKPMYKCQDIPILVFGKRCPNPCLYCGFYGYQFPEDNVIASGLENVIKKVSEFKGIYISPVTDCFLPENSPMTHEILEEVWKLNRNWVPLVITKQIIPAKTIDLLVKNKDRLVLQVSIPTIDEEITQVLEPGSASICDRLEMISNLTSLGIKVICVVMPYFQFDDPNTFAQTLKNVGVERVITATGILIEVTKSKMSHSSNEDIKEMTKLFSSIRDKYILPKETRIEILSELFSSLKNYGIKCKICTCDNHDLEDTNLPLCHQFNHKNFK